MELCKLAIWHSVQYADVNTNLVGIQTTKQLEMNMDVLRNGITEREKALLQEIQEK
jgi:aryl-alcohol dehydrogenase-like predicted oxidoreductase